MARCTADTLDAADDVCNGCGQPFCEEHLIRARGAKKKPLCRECAVAKAGLRHKELRTSQASRSEVRKNRKMVRKAEKVSMEHTFEYFDEAPAASGSTRRTATEREHDAAASFDEDPDEKPKRGRRRRKATDEPDTTTTTNEQTSPPAVKAAQASAADLWEQIRADSPQVEEPRPSLSPPPPTAAPDEPWMQPGPFEPEPERGMPSTFDAPRHQIDAPPPPAPAPGPAPLAPPQRSEAPIASSPPVVPSAPAGPPPTAAPPASLAAPRPATPPPAPPAPASPPAAARPSGPHAEELLSDWATPEHTTQRPPSTAPAPGIHPAASAPAFDEPAADTSFDPPPTAQPEPAWRPAPVNEIDFGFDAVDAVDSLGRPLFGRRPDPTPPAPREIPPAFAEPPNPTVPDALRPRPADRDATEPTSPHDDVPDALRPR